MSRSKTEDSYRARIDRVLAHIEQSLANGGDELDLDSLAEIACFSRFHFQRIYRTVTGETPSQTVRRMRLHRAAVALSTSDRPVAEIARENGYGAVEAFTRAFAAAYAAAPGVFRAETARQEMDMTTTEIRDLPARRIAALEHKGAYHAIGACFERVAIWASGKGLLGPGALMIGVYFDDPQTVPEAELRSLAGVTVAAEAAIETPAVDHELPAGEHLIYRHVGPYSELPKAWDQLYQQLTKGDRAPAQSAPFEIYLNDPTNTPPAELITEICVPLAAG